MKKPEMIEGPEPFERFRDATRAILPVRRKTLRLVAFIMSKAR